MKAAVLGFGTVGQNVCRMVDERRGLELHQLEISHILIREGRPLTDPRMTSCFQDILSDPETAAVVECMGGDEPAHEYVAAALKAGKHVVTSNKKMLARHSEELFALASSQSLALRFEASSGGGIPWLTNLDRIRRVDRIDSIRGILNGTTNYILCGMMNHDTPFDQILAETQRLGYAEKDPSEDIDGDDACYKVVLSAAKAFDALVDPSSVITYGIRHIKPEDIDFCRSRGRTCKLVGMSENYGSYVTAVVLPMFLTTQDVFANIPLNFNALESNCQSLGSAVFVGQGAGGLPTAHAVVQDLVDICLGQDICLKPKAAKPVVNSSYRGIYYLRTSEPTATMPSLAALPGERINDHTIVTDEMSLLEVDKAARLSGSPSLFLAELY